LDDNVAVNISKAKLFVIDEISMVRADLFRAIDLLCRKARNEPNKFFGGIQLVMFGDLYQLPPVVAEPAVEDSYNENGEPISKTPVRDYLKSHFNGVYFFNCPDVLDNVHFIELDKVYRQEDIDFINILNNIRVGKDLPETLRLLNTRVITPEEDSKYITLCTTNKTADITNNDRLNMLDTPLVEHEGVIEGIANELPTLKRLKLKVGAHVMTIVNGTDYRNGSIGVIEEIDKAHAILKVRLFDNDKLVEIKPYEWEYAVYKYDRFKGSYLREVVGSFRQWPVKLAWAITIHKSQGQTFDSVYLKPGNFFSKGQTYVALSRCRSLEKLYLARPIEFKDISVSEKIKGFMDTIKAKNGGPNEKC
jgi:ATP-dependent exoDNAse (exonuclease V) alpha subunit